MRNQKENNSSVYIDTIIQYLQLADESELKVIYTFVRTLLKDKVKQNSKRMICSMTKHDLQYEKIWR